MTLSDILPPERVREIALRVTVNSPLVFTRTDCGEAAINAAAPEIARAALELAAKRCEKEHRYDLADVLRQMAKEITDA